jgi:hypothetical protein
MIRTSFVGQVGNLRPSGTRPGRPCTKPAVNPRFLKPGTLLFALLLAAHAHAAEVSGRIQYSGDVPIDRASVTLINQDTGVRHATDSNSDGYYHIGGAQPGVYKLMVRKTGFKSAVRLDIRLEVDQLARIDFTLRLGPVEETVTVETDRYPVDTEDASVSTVIGRDLMESLPLNGRGLLTLLEAAPGVVVTPASSSGDSGQFSVSGQRADANYITVDGISMNGGIAAPLGTSSTVRQSAGGALPPFTAIGSMQSLVSMESLEEFRLQTATARVDSGRMPGGQLALSTRSGANDWHGALFEHFRHEAVDANDWFANSAALARPPLRFDDYGGVLGGPVLRNRTFFFLSHESVYLRQSPVESDVEVPDAAERQKASPAMQPFVNSLPLPTQPLPYQDNAGTCTLVGKDLSNVYSDSLRIDHTLTSHVQLFARYNHAPSSDSLTLSGGAQQNALDLSLDSITAGLDASIDSRWQASARFGYLATAESVSLHGWGAPGQIYPGFAQAANTPVADTAYELVSSLEGASVPFVNWASHYRQRQWNLVGSSGYSAGKHALRIGADFRTLSPNMRTLPYIAQVLFSEPGPSLGIDALVEGQFSFLSLTASLPAAFHLHNLSLFAEDTWKLSAKLTLSGGVRYESNPPPVAAVRQPLFASIPLGGSAQEIAVSADGHDLWKQGYNHFAPRTSVAFRPSLHRGLVMRGAVGAFYDLGFGPALEGNFVIGSLTQIVSLPVPSGPPQYMVIPMSPGPPTYLLARDFRTPFTVRWSAAIEQTFANRALISISYVGATGHHLLRGENVNGQQVVSNQGFSHYQALQTQARARVFPNLQALLSFAWAHSTDNVSNDSVPNSYSGFPTPLPDADRGNSDFDVRLSMFAALVYDVPHLRGWQIDGILRSRTGFPFSVFSDWPEGRANLVANRPQWIEDSRVPGGRRLNPVAFSAPPSGVQGTLGRNAIAGPGMWQLDLALQRQFRLSERAALQFRVEAFNLTNHPNFGNPDNLLTDYAFGYPASMLNSYLGSGGPASGLAPALQIGGPRALQIGLRLRF